MASPGSRSDPNRWANHLKPPPRGLKARDGRRLTPVGNDVGASEAVARLPIPSGCMERRRPIAVTVAALRIVRMTSSYSRLYNQNTRFFNNVGKNITLTNLPLDGLIVSWPIGYRCAVPSLSYRTGVLVSYIIRQYRDVDAGPDCQQLLYEYVCCKA